MINPLLVGFLGVLGGGVIVAFCHAIIVFCNDHQRPTRNGTFLVTPREDDAVASAAARVDCPTVHVNIVTMFQTKEEVCAVCLGEFKESEGVRVLRDCSHVFHVSCIDKWLEIHPNCPLCRASAAVTVPLSDHGRASTEAEINGTREPAEVGGNAV